jgi:hypothetical protein
MRSHVICCWLRWGQHKGNDTRSIRPEAEGATAQPRPPSLRYGAPSSDGQHSRITWPRRRPCGVGVSYLLSAEGAIGLK